MNDGSSGLHAGVVIPINDTDAAVVPFSEVSSESVVSKLCQVERNFWFPRTADINDLISFAVFETCQIDQTFQGPRPVANVVDELGSKSSDIPMKRRVRD